MSKGKSYPAPVSHVAKEVKAGGHVLLWVVAAIVALFVLGPKILPWAGGQATQAGEQIVKGSLKETGRQAAGVCDEGGLNHLCALPDPTNGVPRGDGPWRTTPTTAATEPPTPRPYGTPNGPVRPLPSQLPAPTIPPSSPEPVLSGPSGGGPLGELLGGVPGVGEALESGVKALGPGLKALNP